MAISTFARSHMANGCTGIQEALGPLAIANQAEEFLPPLRPHVELAAEGSGGGRASDPGSRASRPRRRYGRHCQRDAVAGGRGGCEVTEAKTTAVRDYVHEELLQRVYRDRLISTPRAILTKEVVLPVAPLVG